MEEKGEELLFEKKLNKIIFSVFVVARKYTHSHSLTHSGEWMSKRTGGRTNARQNQLIKCLHFASRKGLILYEWNKFLHLFAFFVGSIFFSLSRLSFFICFSSNHMDWMNESRNLKAFFFITWSHCLVWQLPRRFSSSKSGEILKNVIHNL